MLALAILMDVISTRTEWKYRLLRPRKDGRIAANQSLLSPSSLLTTEPTLVPCPKSDVTYVQNGVVCASHSKVAGISGNVIDTAFCAAELSAFGETTSFTTRVGMAAVSAALKAGMVLVMSLWDDYAVDMLVAGQHYPVKLDQPRLPPVYLPYDW